MKATIREVKNMEDMNLARFNDKIFAKIHYIVGTDHGYDDSDTYTLFGC